MKKNLSLIILMALGLIFGVGADLNSLAYQNSPTKIDFVKGPFELSQNGAGDAAVEQSAGINASFGTQLQATVTESGNPVSGATVTFTAPGSGPSGTFPGGVTSVNVMTNGSGIATAPVFTANGTSGGPYNVTASLGAGLPSANFALTNAKAASSTSLNTSTTPSALGQSVTFTAWVMPGPPALGVGSESNASLAALVLVPTGTVQFKDNGVNLGAPVSLNASAIASLTTSTLTLGAHTITADYSGDANFNPSTGTLSVGQAVNYKPLLKFSQSNYSVNENAKIITITMIRSGDTTPAVTVDYTSPDDSAALTSLPCSTTIGVAAPGCDFTTTIGSLQFAGGETSKTFDVLISQDSFVEGPETFPLTVTYLSGGAAFAQPSDASTTVTIVDDDMVASSINPIDAENFVRQQYHDLLNREPDAPGLAFWTSQITKCGANSACIGWALEPHSSIVTLARTMYGSSA